MGRRPERPCGSDHMWSYKLLRAMVFTQLIGEVTQAEQGWYGIFPFNDTKGLTCKNRYSELRGVPLQDKHVARRAVRPDGGRGDAVKMGTVWSQLQSPSREGQPAAIGSPDSIPEPRG